MAGNDLVGKVLTVEPYKQTQAVQERNNANGDNLPERSQTLHQMRRQPPASLLLCSISCWSVLDSLSTGVGTPRCPLYLMILRL